MKKYCSVFQDGFEIKVACVERQGGKIKILNFISVPSSENQFVFSTKEINGGKTADLDFDITEFDEPNQIKTNLVEISNFYRIEELPFIPVITEPYISYLVHQFDNGKKPGDLKSKIAAEWKENTNIDYSPDRIDYIEYKNHFLISTVVQENIPILNELKSLAEIAESKTLDILPLRSADIALINYTLNIYKPAKDETYLLIYIGTDSIRLIFIKDGKVTHINKYLGLSLERQGIVSFLSSKIVLEMEYANVTELTNIILTGEINDDLLSAVKQSFPFASVDLLDLQIFDFSSLEEETVHKAQSYILPLVAVCDEVFRFSNIKKNLEFQTKRLSKISFFKKIDFLSIFLVMLIGALMFFSLQMYKERSSNLKKFRAQISRMEVIKSISSADLARINQLSNRYEILNAYKQNLEEAEKNLKRITDQLLLIESFNPHKNKIWLTSIAVDEKNPSLFLIKGLAIDRSKIPDLMAALHNAELKNIYIYEIRNKKIYQFELTTLVKN
jgi:hypothetical protein